MTDNITTPIPSSTKFKTKDTGANGHMPAHVIFDSASGEILGTTADAKNVATDTTAVSAMSVWKQISASVQSLAGVVGSSKAAVKAASGDFVDGAIATIGTKADAANTATDTTSVSGISIWKQISASVQALAGAVSSSKVATKAASGDFVDGSIATLGTKADAKSTATDTTSVSIMQVIKQISASVQGTLTVASHAVTNAGTFAVQATQETSAVSNAGTGLTPKFAKVSAGSSGANTIVAAVTSKKIRVLAWDVVANAAVNFKWQSHVTPTDLTGLYYMGGQGNGVARSFNPLGYFETTAGEALDINLSGAVAVGGSIVYIEV